MPIVATILKVGTPKSVKKNSKKKSVIVDYTYSDVEFDEDGWADAKRFMPQDFDLCHLKIKDKRTRSGWASGNKWDGLHIQSDDKILYWKINRE